jgi:hypothetical protein
MTRHYAYTNTELNSLLQQKDNGTSPSTQMILQLKPSALKTEPTTQTIELLSTQAMPLNMSGKKHWTTSMPSKMLA